MNKITSFLLLSTALAFTGCSGSGTPATGSILNPPPVQAATYSNASVTGTYAVNFNTANGSVAFTSIGTLVADGNGSITSGALTEYGLGTGNICTATVTGTYTVKTDASGTANLATKPSGTTPCSVAGTVQLVLQAAQQGQALLLTGSDGTAIASGTALKQ